MWLPKCSFRFYQSHSDSSDSDFIEFMTPSLVKASFITRSNICGFPETNKTIVVILTMFPLKKQVQYFYATYIVHVWKITENPLHIFILK